MVKGILTILFMYALTMAQGDGESKELRAKRLKLEEAQLSLENTESKLKKRESEWDEAKSLFKQGLFDKNELNAAESNYSQSKLERSQAKINLEKTQLSFLNDASYITLVKASLYLDQENKKHVALELKNASHIDRIIDKKYSLKDKKSLLKIENISVKILLNGKLVGVPIEVRIPALYYGQTKIVDFLLQKSTEDVTVELAYGEINEQFPVYLGIEEAQGSNKVTIEALQFSQEGELGGQVHYDLELESLSKDNKSFALQLVNLPQEYTSNFTEGQNNISQIRFKKNTTSSAIRLSINVPLELPKIQLDKKFGFFILVLDRVAEKRLTQLKTQSQGRPLTRADMDSARLAYEFLEFTPRGRAEFTISANNLFHKMKIGEIVDFKFKLTNDGTVELTRIRISPALPLDWSANITPEKDITLEVQGEQPIQMELFPAPDVAVGDYEIKIQASTMHQGREIMADPKTLRIQVEGKSNFLAAIVLMVVLIGLVLGVAVFTIRISRR